MDLRSCSLTPMKSDVWTNSALWIRMLNRSTSFMQIRNLYISLVRFGTTLFWHRRGKQSNKLWWILFEKSNKRPLVEEICGSFWQCHIYHYLHLLLSFFFSSSFCYFLCEKTWTSTWKKKTENRIGILLHFQGISRKFKLSSFHLSRVGFSFSNING